MPFKRSVNYNRWSKNIQEIFALDHCWLVTIRKNTALKTPQALFKEKAALFSGNIVIAKAVVNTKLAKDVYKTEIKRYKEKLFK